MTFFEIMILAVIQGLTEFLPVSSSGHLSMMQTIFERSKGILTENATLDILLHFGTLLATVLFFRKEILALVRGLFPGLQREDSVFRGRGRRMIVLIICALVPTGAIGLGLGPIFEKMLHNNLLVGIMFGLTAAILYTSRYFVPSKSFASVTMADAFIIGIIQGIAVMPGLSRSGVTIATALMLGWDRKDAFDFSFLISIPAILGATLLEIKHLQFQDMSTMRNYCAGLIIAGVIGYVSLIFLRHMVIGKRFYLFSFYCAAAAIASIIIYLI